MDIEAPIIVIIVLAVSAALIYAWYLACREFSRIADAKGFAGSYYFHFCFWMGLIGMLMVAALPDRRGGAAAPAQQSTAEPRPVPVAFANARKMASAVAPAVVRAITAAKPSSPNPAAAPAPVSSSEWRCSCGRLSHTRKCAACEAWRCSCGTVHPAFRATCDVCGDVKPR